MLRWFRGQRPRLLRNGGLKNRAITSSDDLRGSLPVVRGQRSSSLLRELSLSGERALFVPPAELPEAFVPFCLGLYEHRFAWSLFTQFSQAFFRSQSRLRIIEKTKGLPRCLLSHLTLRCLHGQHAVPAHA